MALSAIDRVRLGLPAATGPTTTARVQRPRRRAMPRARSSSRIAAYVPPENRVKRKNPLDKLLDDGDKKGWRQIPGGISRAFEGVILGAPKLATMVGKQALAPVRAGIDVAQGELDPGQALALSNPAIGGALAISGNPAASKYQPLTADMAASGKQTAHRVTNPTEYKKAWDEGTLVDVLLEDAGNISLVAGGVGGVLGNGSTAARAAGATAAADNLAKAATVARRVSKLGGQTSDLPISIPRAGLNKAKRATIKYGEAARGGKYGTGLRKAVADALPQYSTGVGRFLTEGVKKLQRSRERAETGPDRQLHRAAVLKHKLTPAEEGAATAIRTGIAWQYKKLIDDGIAPDDARTTITHRDIDEQTFTPETAVAAQAYMDGTMPAERIAAIDGYLETVNKVIDTNTTRALAGVGRSKAMDAAQLGDDAILEYVENAIEEASNASVAAGGPKFDMSNIDPALLEDILDNPMVYPAAWRPSMRASGLARDAGFKNRAGSPLDVPHRPAEVLAAGGVRPGYLPGGRSDRVYPKSVGIGRRPIREGLRGYQDVRSEHTRAVNEIQPGSARTIGERAGQEMGETTMNEGLVEMFSDPRIQHGTDVFSATEITDLKAEANRRATAQRNPGAYDEIYGGMLIEEMAAKGYEPLVGNVANPSKGDFDPSHKVLKFEVNENTIALPTGMKARLIPYMVGKDMNKFLQGLEWINTKFKGLVLPASVRWHLGDAVGGAYMAWMGGGVNPARLAQGMKMLGKIDEKHTNAIFDDPNFHAAGGTYEETAWAQGIGAKPTARTPIGKNWQKFQQKSYRFNGAINRLNRQGYVLAKLDDYLQAKNGGKPVDLTDPNFPWQDPNVQTAISEAIDDANRVMGTFDEMTPFERRVTRNLFPFYAWSRHITGLALKTAIDHPSRMMWTMNLGMYGMEGSDEELPWLKGSFEVAGQVFPTAFINPLNDVASGNMYTPTGAIKSLSPGIKIAAGAVGFDANNRFAAMSRPYDAGGLDELGRESPFRIASATELAYIVARQFPQSRAALSLAPTAEVAGIGLGPHQRFDTGSLMVDKKGEPFDTNSRWQSAGSLVGLPWPTSKEDEQAILETKRKREEAAKKRAQNTVRYHDVP
jgi:hypothetical protein